MRRYVKYTKPKNKRLGAFLSGSGGGIPSSIMEKNPVFGDLEWIVETKGVMLTMAKEDHEDIVDDMHLLACIGIQAGTYLKCRWAYDNADNEDALLYIDFACPYVTAVLGLVARHLLMNRLGEVSDEAS